MLYILRVGTYEIKGVGTTGQEGLGSPRNAETTGAKVSLLPPQ